MTRKITQYTEDFKKEAVVLALKSESVSQVAKNLGIPDATLYGWIKNTTNNGGKNLSCNSQLDMHEELKKLRKENAQLRDDREILKKAATYFAKKIKQNSRSFSVKRMCVILGVSKNCYYRWLHYPISNSEKDNLLLSKQINETYTDARKLYGYRKVHAALRAANVTCSKNRVQRLINESGLQAKVKRRFKITTDSKHNLPVAENLLDRQFEIA
ncbi:MAG: IS3 family transposase ISNisp1 [Holosporales bacterium]